MYLYIVSVSEDADDGRFGQHIHTYKRLFDLLSCQRIYEAVDLAEKAGMFRLATLLSQLDGDASVPALMRQQLEIWRISEAEVTIDPELMKLYRLIAGTVITEDLFLSESSNSSNSCSSLLGLGWLRDICLLFWYCSSSDSFIENISTMSSALESYRMVLQDGYADAPLSAYIDDYAPFGADVSYPATQHGLYSLLELLYPSASSSGGSSSGGRCNNGTTGSQDDDNNSSEASLALSMDLDGTGLELEIRNSVITALSPAGYTRDALDYRASYLLLVMLECAGISDRDAVHAHIIRQHYIFQLLSAGLWQWAVYVALQISDVSTRYSLVNDIVLRWGAPDTWDTQEESSALDNHTTTSAALTNRNSYNNGSPQSFLIRSLSLPEALLHEAASYYCGYEHSYTKQVSHLISASLYTQATEVTVLKIAPTAMLASGAASRNLLLLLETIAEQQQKDEDETRLGGVRYKDHYEDISNIFLSYLRLKDAVEALSSTSNTSNSTSSSNMEDDYYYEDSDRKDATTMVMEIPEIVSESRSILQRLSVLHQQRMQVSPTNVSNIEKEEDNKLVQVVLYEMGTYLYNLLLKLEQVLTTATTAAAGYDRNGEGMAEELLSEQYLEQAPVLNEALLSCTNFYNNAYLNDAALRLMATVTVR